MTYAMKLQFVGTSIVLALLVGCSGPPDPIADLKAAVAEINAGLEAGDIEAVDAVMHRKSFGDSLDAMVAAAEDPSVSPSAREALSKAKDGVMAELKAIHKEAPGHGGGGIEAIDVPTAIANLNAAMADFEAALPDGWSLPEAE